MPEAEKGEIDGPNCRATGESAITTARTTISKAGHVLDISFSKRASESQRAVEK
jgi:hypothetical protein